VAAQVLLAVAAGEVEDPAGEALGVLDEEEGQEQAQDQPGEHLPDQGHPMDGALGEAAGVLGEALAGLVQVAVEVGLAQPERPRGDVALHLGHALIGPLAQGLQLVADQGDEPGDDGRDQQHGPAEHGQHGPDVAPAPPLQDLDQRHQQSGQEQGHDHRDDDDLEQDEQVQHQPGREQHHQQPPAPGGQPPQRRRDLGPFVAAHGSSRVGGRTRGIALADGAKTTTRR
jgi:hypothetical protein